MFVSLPPPVIMHPATTPYFNECLSFQFFAPSSFNRGVYDGLGISCLRMKLKNGKVSSIMKYRGGAGLKFKETEAKDLKR